MAPVKMIGASPARGVGLSKNTKSFGRSRSTRAEDEEDVYEEEFGGRASSRSKNRIARAELLGIDDNVVVGRRELRSRSAARVRGAVDIEMDVGEEETTVPKSRSSSRMRGRKEEALHESREVRSLSASRSVRNGVDAPEIDERLYSARSLQSTPRPQSRVATPRSSVKASREQEDSRAPPEVPSVEEIRGRRIGLSCLDSEDVVVTEKRERVSYRAPAKSPRASRENSDLPEERLLRVERLSKRPGRSPKKLVDDVVDVQVEPVASQAERAPRRNVRKADLDGPEDEEDATGLYRRGGKAVRQPKRKMRDIPRDPASMLPVSQPPECEMVDVTPLEPADPFLLPPSPTTSSRSPRETGTCRIGWLNVIGDLIMWKDVPRSTLWFGAGTFSILSASFMKEMQLGLVAISANLALCYLAVVFFYQTFSRRAPDLLTGQSKGGQVTEADLIGLIRFTLPAINLALKKAREVFSGDPLTTLRVAIVLWLVAKVGAGISVWSFLRYGFFALFTIPKCHSNYSTQIYAFGQSLLERAWATWDSFAHKRAILIGGFLLAWNISSYSSRLWGGFILVVWLKFYQQSNPASFEKALADASASSAIDRIDRRKSLQLTTTASRGSQAAPVANDGPAPN